MLPGGAAEAAEYMVSHVVPALRGDPLDRACHRFAGHAHEVVGELLRRRRFDAGGAHARGHGRERRARRRLVDGPGAVRSEHVREEGRPQLARHQVAVGDCEGPALAVARRPGVGAGAARADPVARVLEGADRAAARGHRVHAQHRRAQAHATDHALVAALQLAGVVAHVGGGAAHVEGDDLREPCAAAHGDGAHDAPRGPREDRVLAAEEAGVGEAAVRLHEAQPHPAELRRHAVHVAAEDGGEVGVDHGRLATADQLHERAGLVRDGDLREAGGACQLRHAPLVSWMGVAVHEGDGDRVESGAAGFLEPAPRLVLIQRPDDRPVGAHALVHLEHARVDGFRQADVEREDVRPVLVADAQGVAEPARGHVERRRAGALQERVGRHRRAHAGLGDELRRYRLVAFERQEAPHPFDGGVRVSRRVLGEELAREQAAAGRSRHHVGERAAAIDPEAPALGRSGTPHSGFISRHGARLPCATSDARGSRSPHPGM